MNIYRAQHYISRLAHQSMVPVVSLINGAVMGSGTMFGLNSTWSVVTERTMWSLPEVTIAGMPDVGALYHMGQLDGQLGTMLALTGYRLTSTSVSQAGLATHFCKSELLADLRQRILSFNGDRNKIAVSLEEFQAASVNQDKENINKDSLLKLKSKCDKVYNSNDMKEIVHNLKMLGDEWSTQQLLLLQKACPLSLK